MAEICPFVNKYISAINAAYPDVEVILGTDPFPDQHLETMRKAMLPKNCSPITTLIFQRIPEDDAVREKIMFLDLQNTLYATL